MTRVLQSKTLTVSIESQPKDVYGFVSDPGNLPKWATAFCQSVRRSDGEWIVDTPDGPMKVRFVEYNEFGVLDHYVSPMPGVEILIPMRVVSNGSGSEVIFTLLRSPNMSAEQFAEDVRLVEHDLRTLKGTLEG